MSPTFATSLNAPLACPNESSSPVCPPVPVPGDGPGAGDVIAQLSAAGARFWVSNAADELGRFSPDRIGGATGRMLLVVDEPERVHAAAVAAGGEATSPVGDEHGWRLGRVRDPFGHEWEVGRPLGAWPPG